MGVSAKLISVLAKLHYTSKYLLLIYALSRVLINTIVHKLNLYFQFLSLHRVASLPVTLQGQQIVVSVLVQKW